MGGNRGWAEPIIHDIERLTVVGRGESPVKIVMENRTGNVLKFSNVTQLRLENLEIGYTDMNGMGSALCCEESKDITVSRCVMTGAARGLTLNGVDGFTLSDSRIRKCLNGIMDLAGSRNIAINKSTFEDNRGAQMFMVVDCPDVIMSEVEIADNKSDQAEPSVMFAIYGGSSVRIERSRIIANDQQTLCDTISPVTADCVFANNAFPAPKGPIVVDKGGNGDYATIGEAVAGAPRGSHIIIKPGLYEESVIIEEDIDLAGDGPADQVIVQSKGPNCLVLRKCSPRLRNLTLRCTGGAGDKASAVEIEDGSPVLTDCLISSSALCLVIHGEQADPAIRSCKLSGGGTGVRFLDKAQGLLEDCEVRGNALCGIEIAEGATPVIRQCVITDGGQDGVCCHGSQSGGLMEDCQVYGCGGSGVRLDDGAVLSMSRCRIATDKQYGIELKGKSTIALERCDLTGCTEGRTWQIEPGCNVKDRGENNPPFPRLSTDESSREPSLLFSDDFSNPSSGWSVGQSGGFIEKYVDGEYYVKINEDNYLCWRVAPFRSVPTSFIVEVDARFPYNDRGGYGLYIASAGGVVRYAFIIEPYRRYYTLNVLRNGEWAEDEELPWRRSDSIKQGSAANKMAIKVIERKILLIVNGAVLDEVMIDGCRGGRVGLCAVGGRDAVTAYFDNFVVRSI